VITSFQFAGSKCCITRLNQRRSASSNPSVLFSSPAQAIQASGRISIEGPVSTATQRIICVLAATSLEPFPPVEASSRTFRQSRDTGEAKAAFLAIVDKGTVGLKAAMAGTPYA
jgi:hypothetical protein